jgi:hypothetical protein
MYVMNMMIVMNVMMRISIPDNTNRIILNVCFSFAGSAWSSDGCDPYFFWAYVMFDVMIRGDHLPVITGRARLFNWKQGANKLIVIFC